MKHLLMLLLLSAHTSAWQIVNDTVMGGRSSSGIEAIDDYIRFSGYLSLENNGGFASARKMIRVNANDPINGLELEVRGDGRQYQLRVQTDQNIGRASYAADFPTTANEWTSVTLRPEDFYLTFRGLTFSDYPTIDFNRTQVISIFITDKQTGPFQLDLKQISALN
ncbi:CIA30 family protein [Salinibius halmophilus]|uniref:CIA30 family protein n=1 Tax=Salinibius halmophilus TaxID=1853216 RepID=UPI000E66325E|nr:CIA30 family protein [Salinibius halmophilus]